MTTTLSRADLAARVPSSHIDAAADVLERSAALAIIPSFADGWPLPARLYPAADSLVRAGVLRAPRPGRWLVAESHAVVL